jgi:hypothetical protein
MSLWTSSVIALLLLQVAPAQSQQAYENKESVVLEEVAASAEELPPRLVVKKDWDLTHAYSDLFTILSSQNTCSNFYGGPRTAITVLNDFVGLVQSRNLSPELSFQMVGKPRLVRNVHTGKRYRLFDRTLVNTNGSFYKHRVDLMHRYPANVGDFSPGTRPARALILLHELGHLIIGENGDWLIPDDGYNGTQSNANTLRVQQVCRAQLETLK